MNMEQEKSRLEELLERIQSAGEAQKKRWLIVSVGLVSVFVVFLWVINFNVMMSGYTAQVVANNASDSPSFFADVGHGLATMGSGLSQGIHSLGNAFATPREDIIKPPQ